MTGLTVDKGLEGKVVVVSGASRGVGKGIALALGGEGATVYVTGREPAHSETALGGSLEETVSAIEARGGVGVAVRCDHGDDAQVRALFERVRQERGRIDVLVNNVYALPRGPVHGVPFWEQPLEVWDLQHRVGLRSHYVASVCAAPMMVEQGSGLIANISSFGGGTFALHVAYGVMKAALDRLARDMAHDLGPHSVTSVSLWPGVVRTERILRDMEHLPFDARVTESPELTGRAIAALAKDPKLLEKNGRRLVVAELAEEYGFTDVDGTRPRSLRQPSR